MVKLSNDTKIDATVSGTEKLKYNIGINKSESGSESESEYVIVKKTKYYIVAFICQLDELTWEQLSSNPWVFLVFILDQNSEWSLEWIQ